MIHVFEVYSPKGLEKVEKDIETSVASVLGEIESELTGSVWYRIQYHFCRNNEQLPCDPWIVLAEVGEIPEVEY